MAKVRVSANNNFRYRKKGLILWNTLLGGVTHIVELENSAEYEFNSVSVTKINITGEIRSISIEKSDISSINDSFSNNFFMTTFTIDSTNIITDAKYALKRDIKLNQVSLSGTSDEMETKDMFYGTLGMGNETDILPLDQSFSDGAFSLSSIVNSIPNLESLSTIAGSKKINIDTELNLTKIDKYNDTVYSAMDSNVLKDKSIMNSCGNILRKNYRNFFDKKIDETMDVEISIKNYVPESSITNNNIVLSNEFNTEKDGLLYNFEVDMIGATNGYIVSNKIENKNIFNKSSSPVMDTQIDIVNNKDALIETANTIAVDQSLFDYQKNALFNLEVDIIAKYTYA